MPYKDISELPKFLSKYSKKLCRQWMYVYNSTWKKLTNEGVTGEEREKRCFKSANSTLKKRFKGKESMVNNTRQDYFTHLTDLFLDNLEG